MSEQILSVMDSEPAGWVREHVWTQRMRAAYADVPGHTTHCACQWGSCGHCAAGRHERCHSRPGASPETYVVFGGAAVAEVWLADRLCRWVCHCSTSHTQPGGQLALFAAGEQRAASDRVTTD